MSEPNQGIGYVQSMTLLMIFQYYKMQMINESILFIRIQVHIIQFQRLSMSNYNTRQDQQYGSARSPSRTERVSRELQLERSPQRLEGYRTEREPLPESPSKYDIQFYQRKVNRLETDMAVLQDELSLTKFKLSKAEDFQRKYEIAFQQNQNLVSQLDLKDHQNTKLTRQIDQLQRKNQQAQLQIRNLQQKVQNERKNNNQLKDRHQQITYKVSNEGKNQKAFIQDNYLREITNLKQSFKAKEQNFKRKIQNLQSEIQTQKSHQKSLKFKLESIKTEKNKQIDRLKGLTNNLRTQLSELNNSTDSRVIEIRTNLITQTQSRIQNVRQLANDIQESLMNEIRNLNETLATKNSQISFILQADRKFMQDNEAIQNGLKAHINRLQDKIFMIQREDEIQLFQTIDRLQKQYQENINSLNDNFDNVRRTHLEEVEQLNEKINNLGKENELLARENVRVEEEHKKLASDKQEAIQMLSQKIIKLESSKDIDLKQYTTSMKEIESDARAKLEDLHMAIQTKNTQFQILNAQINLKNLQINSLIEEIDKIRNQNRQKMKKLQMKNSTEQNTLNDLIKSARKDNQQLRRRINQLQTQISDQQAQYDLKMNLMRQDLESQKQANQMLKSRNNFLLEWCQQLERDLKAERVSNVNILHDTNISRRETVQIREQVKVQLEAIKDKEVEQIKNIFKLEKNRLEADLLNKEHQLREKKEEIARLLAEYKKLQNKVGKPSKFDRGAEEEGKCRATLNAEILLTENIFNAINTQ